jgi:hypothetical protein
VALVDVTELLGDPDFVGPIRQISRQYRVDSFGKNVLTECPHDTVGSVQPISPADLQRLPEQLRVGNLMTFFMKGTITASSPGKYTDVLMYRGLRFQVLTVNDWSAWGAGWCEGACVAEVPAP